MSYDQWKLRSPDDERSDEYPPDSGEPWTAPRIVTWKDDQAAFWTFGKEGWCAARDGWEPPDSDGVGGSCLGIGATREAAIIDLLAQEEDAE